MPQLPPDAIFNLTPGNHYSEEQEEFFGQYVAEFAVEINLKLHDEEFMKAIELFDECTHRWQSDPNRSIQHMAKGHDFVEIDEEIIGIPVLLPLAI